MATIWHGPNFAWFPLQKANKVGHALVVIEVRCVSLGRDLWREALLETLWISWLSQILLEVFMADGSAGVLMDEVKDEPKVE